MTAALLIGGWLLAAGLVLAVVFRRAVAVAWCEPVLAHPVLIIEGDDWGYGPRAQAASLDAIARILLAHRDATARPAVMTVAVVLAGPDSRRNRNHGIEGTHRLLLDSRALAPVLASLQRGRALGVFALQLHGMEHYWPETLHQAAESDDALRQWLTSEALPASESLPSPLQSRWIDASQLPSRPLPRSAKRLAAIEEVAEFERIFGERPQVVVPPTFVWDAEVEAAWAESGLRTLVTPGRRYAGRGVDGRPIAEADSYHNGESTPDGLTRIVRNDYFEPSFGHRPQQALAALATNTRLGRPTLLETHRSNFIGEASVAQASYDALDTMLDGALERHPDIRFVSTAELAEAYRQPRSVLRDPRPLRRLRVFMLRLSEVSRLRKLAWATGVALPVWLFLAASSPLRR